MIETAKLRAWSVQMRPLIADIAAALGPDFILIPVERDRAELNPEALPSIRDEGGRVIHFERGHGYTDEALKYLKISAGKWPSAPTLSGSTEVYTPRSVFDGIQVTWSRGPRVIAKEIKRRFLPAYILEYAKCQERANEARAFVESTRKAYSDLVQACGIDQVYLRPRELEKLEIRSIDILDDSYGHIRVNSQDSVEFHLQGVNLGVAVKIAAALRSINESKEAEPCTPPTL